MLEKRLISILLAVLSALTFTVSSYAVEIDEYELPVVDIDEYQTVTKVLSGLSVSGTTATCRSEAIVMIGVTNISVTQTLQKRSGNNFSNVNGASWSTTVNDDCIIFENTKSNLSSGTYRVKSVFTVKKGSKTETITSYSSTATI